MKEIFEKGLAIGLGLAVASKEQIEKMVDELVKKGEVTAAESKDLLKDLMEKGEAGKKELNDRIRAQVEKLLQELNAPAKVDIENLEKRIQGLEEQLQGLKERIKD